MMKTDLKILDDVSCREMEENDRELVKGHVAFSASRFHTQVPRLR